MSAAERAEARRKAILSRGTDRLAKLTTSGRGADAPAYMHDADPPLPNLSAGQNNFQGQDSSKPPTHGSSSPSPRPSSSPRPTRSSNVDSPFSSAGASPDPPVWSEQQQQQFLQALMGGVPNPSHPDQPRLPSFFDDEDEPPMPELDNPLAAMLSSFTQEGGGAFPPSAAGKAPSADAAVQPTRLQKLMPFIHLITMWGLLGYFVLYKEPNVYDEQGGAVGVGVWRRWAELGWRSPATAKNAGIGGGGWGFHVVPFFWAFTTLQIALHSVRIFSGFDAIQPPMLLALALPHLPPPFPSIIVNGLKYFQMGSMFLDDLAALVVGIGFIVSFAGWFT